MELRERLQRANRECKDEINKEDVELLGNGLVHAEDHICLSVCACVCEGGGGYTHIGSACLLPHYPLH